MMHRQYIPDLMYYFALLCQFVVLYMHSFDIMNIVPFLHQTCRNTIYAQTNIKRFPVPDHLVSWANNYAEYKPIFYESSNLIGKSFADPSIGL